jgi:malate synthase
MKREIPYYNDYISENFQDYLSSEAKDYPGVEGLKHIGATGGLEDKESLTFVCELYDKVKERLNTTLNNRIKDRAFIDQRVKAYYQYNQEQENDFLTGAYKTILGDEDEHGRIVIGPKLKNYCGKSEANKVAPIPDYLQGFHVTLFGPPDDPKLSINAMNAYHRKLKDEPAIVSDILKTNTDLPKWGADDEDSKTPLRSDLITAAENLTGCFNGDISFHDEKRNKTYDLEKDFLSQPIKRFPGLALPSSFMFYQGNPLPLHLYDFAVHLFHHWHNPKALCFYVPKLENEEEAAYIKFMIETAETMIQKKHPEYKLGTVRVIIVLENPRAVFRVNEIMDELYPYFVGASLGWHDYLGSTARLFKEDGNYRIPVKADPDIVIKYIKASHELLANVVGERGGIKIGGMYGILPITNDLQSDSFQITIRGFFRDVLTQMKRNLSGYWVAHPDFIRIGIAIVEAWKFYAKGEEEKLKGIIDGLLNENMPKRFGTLLNQKTLKA